MGWRRGLAAAVLLGLLASCTPEGEAGGSDDADGSAGTSEAGADAAPSTSGDATGTRTDVVLSLPAEATAEQREAVARTLEVRAQAVASGVSVDVDGDNVTVTLAGVADASAGHALVDESLLSVGAVLETRMPDDPDWPGCDPPDAGIEDDAEEPAWRCEDGADVAHLVEVGWSMGRPSGVEVAESTVSVDLADADAVRFGDLTADLACERDAGGPGMLAVLAGSRVLLAAGISPEVACGEGLRDGSVTIALGPDQGAEAAERLADALRSSFEVTPELHGVSVVTEQPAP